MGASRKRWIVTRSALVLVVAAMLPVWYLATFACSGWLVDKRLVQYETVCMLDSTLFAPLRLYGESELPGRFWLWKIGNGTGRGWVQYYPPGPVFRLHGERR